MDVVKIRLRKPRRVFSFLCSELTLDRDDQCIVLSDRGEEWGTCILPPEPCPQEMAKRYSMKVVRKVTEKDEKNHSFIESEEQKARAICLKKIKSRFLPMKLVDVEFTFDKKKIVFYFTADDRVDFRELVRDLAHDLRARIEMRHIQVRDEAKMVGGIGGCGRELCCSSWMNEFQPISMRMAKAQNLSLNPSKISGQCGRLLCCLSYENEQYEAMRKQARQRSKAAKEAAESKAAAAPERADSVAVAERTGGGTRPSSDTPDRARKPRPPRTADGAVEVSATAPKEAAGNGPAPEAATDGQNPDGHKRSRNRRNRKRKRSPGAPGSSEGQS